MNDIRTLRRKISLTIAAVAAAVAMTLGAAPANAVMVVGSLPQPVPTRPAVEFAPSLPGPLVDPASYVPWDSITFGWDPFNTGQECWPDGVPLAGLCIFISG